MRFERENAEVYYTTERLSSAGREAIDFLKERALGNPRGSCRLCFHERPEDPFQEMLIVHRRERQQLPHRHLGRPQSICVIEGRALFVIFDEAGEITRLFDAGGPKGPFYLRFPADTYYSFIVRTRWFVMLEALIGGFRQGGVQWAPWAPSDQDEAGARRYMRDLRRRIKTYREEAPASL